jgi:hypothetical protein
VKSQELLTVVVAFNSFIILKLPLRHRQLLKEFRSCQVLSLVRVSNSSEVWVKGPLVA